MVVQSTTTLELHEDKNLKVDPVMHHDVDEEFIREAVAKADVNTLRIALCQLMKDKQLESMHVRQVDIRGGGLIDFVLSEEDQKIVRAKAVEYLLSRPHDVPPPPSADEGHRLIDLFSDFHVTSNADEIFDYGEAFEELSFPEFPRKTQWSKGAPLPDQLADWKVIIVGAGVSGIAAAIPLKQLGVPFEIIDRQADIGGTWLLNSYPAVRVDSPSALYQYSFTKEYRWKEVFPSGSSIREYLEYVVKKYDIRKEMSFNREVIKAIWNAKSSQWELTIKHKDGTTETQNCNFVISCSGLFSTPSLPDINGIESCKRPIFHTSQWDSKLDYSGKDIALIGTGSTGCQIAPALARSAKSLTVYQRTANWIAPNPFYNTLVPDKLNWLYDNMPYYWNWNRFVVFYKSLNFSRLQIRDQEWQASGGGVSKRNDGLRNFLTGFIHDHFKDRPDLATKMLPKLPPSVRRLVVDNGFYDAVLQDNVELITEPIERITETGISTRDGKEREFDMIVLGSGWKVAQYLHPVDYEGTDGMTLQKLWEKDGARSYLGMTMRNYPNMFTLYGPNHQPRAGSLFSCCEMWARYAASSIVHVIEQGAKSLELKPEVWDNYQAKLDIQAKKAIWEAEGAGYFVNKHGRQGVNNPFTNGQYHPMIREVNFEDFIIR